MKKGIIFSSIFTCLFLGSCANDIEGTSKVQEITSISLQSEDAQFEDLTRSNISTSYEFSWADGDEIGICPSEGDQLSFKIPASDVGSKFANFDGGGWSMKASYTYTAYYPFNRDAFLGSLSEIPISYLGQKQTANGSTSHLGAYDYSVSERSEVSADGAISFSLKRISTITKFALTLPETGPFTQLIVSSDNVPFVTEGTFSAVDGNIEVTPTKTSESITFYLDNISTSSVSDKLTIYALMCPQSFNGSHWTFKVLTAINNGKYKEYTLTGAATVNDRKANAGTTYTRPGSNSVVPNAPFVCKEHLAFEYPYPSQEGVTGSAYDFIFVGGTTNNAD